MRIAVPCYEGVLCLHFGHCEQFALVEVDDSTRTVTGVEMADPPPHQPGVLPRWLAELGVTAIIAGGMGSRAQNLFRDAGVEVVVGAPSLEPRQLVESYLAGRLSVGDNVCDH